MIILKQISEYDQPPLLILRRGYNRNNSTLYQSDVNPNWWKEQLISRNYQLPQGQKYELMHQRMHGRYHYLFFNRLQLFRNPMDDFLPTILQETEVSNLL